MKFRFFPYFLILLGFSKLTWAQDPRALIPSPEILKQVEEYNWRLSKSKKPQQGQTYPQVLRPFAEFERARYVLMDSSDYFESQIVKDTIAKNLPLGVSLVIVTDESEKAVKAQYLPLVPSPERLKVLKVKKAPGFWARDTLPVPVFLNFPNAFQAGLANALYFRGNEPDAEVSEYFHAPLTINEYFYEGGNFLSDDQGNCFAIETRAQSIPDEVFHKAYGCTTFTRLPDAGGIGHIDERVKFVTSIDVLTDTEAYIKIFEDKGYRVSLLPRAPKEFETYVNALLVNGTAFLPIFQGPGDEQAIKIYESFRFKVIPIHVDALPNKGLGSIHCITMTYPETPLDYLKN